MSTHNGLRGLIFFLCSLATITLASHAWADLVIGVDEELRGNYELTTNVTNHGLLAGLDESQRLTLGQGFTLTGAGALENVTILGTYSPGNSAAIINGTNQQIGGTVEIELGGTSPGFGANNHDLINDSDTLEFLPTSTLSVLPFNGFIPANGDTFTIFTWQTQLLGNFGTLQFDPFYATNGVSFTVNIINPTGTGSLVLNASVIPEAGQMLCGMAVFVLIGCKRALQRRRCRDC